LDLLITYRWYLQLLIPLFLIVTLQITPCQSPQSVSTCLYCPFSNNGFIKQEVALQVTSNIPTKKVFQSHFKSSHRDEIFSSRQFTYNCHFQPRTGYQSQSRITTDGQSASLPWYQAPIWSLRPDYYYCQAVVCLFMWGDLCDERTDLPLTSDAGPRQRSHFWVLVPRDSWPYFTETLTPTAQKIHPLLLKHVYRIIA
jgi:hypothetical protein